MTSSGSRRWDILWYSAIWHDQHTPTYWMVLSVNTWWMVCMIQKSISQKKWLKRSLIGWFMPQLILGKLAQLWSTAMHQLAPWALFIATKVTEFVPSVPCLSRISPSKVSYRAKWSLRGNKFLRRWFGWSWLQFNKMKHPQTRMLKWRFLMVS